MLVDGLAPTSHPDALNRIARSQRHRREDVLELLVDGRRFGEDGAVVDLHRQLAIPMDRYELGPRLLEAQQVDVVTDESELLLLKAQEGLHGVGGRFGVLELEHGAWARNASVCKPHLVAERPATLDLR